MRRHLLAILLLFPPVLLAQDLSSCATIDAEEDRLRCYDALSGRTAARQAAAGEPDADISRWERRLIQDAEREPFALTAFEPSYLLYTHLSSFNHEPYDFADPMRRLRDDEAKFHLSMQFKFADDLVRGDGDLWFGYTQTAFWQILSGDISSPFREVNHAPEAYLSFLTDYPALGFSGRTINVGFVHESNGQSEPLSRSWNRVFADLRFVRGNLGVSVRPWVRLTEDRETDDNPDIEKYLGNYEARISWEKNDHLFSLMFRNVFDETDLYGAELSWSFPISGRLRGLVQWYSGYGENLVDYNHRNNRVGIGVLISDWL